MKKKLILLSRWAFVLALGIFALSYFLFHHLASDGTITAVYQAAANKPVVTLLFAILGVLFLFTSAISRLIAHIFFSSEKTLSARVDRVVRELEKFINTQQQEHCDIS